MIVRPLSLAFRVAVLASVCAFPLTTSAQTFEESLKSAYERNPDIMAERENLKATDERVNQAISGWMPTAVFDYSKSDETTRTGTRPEEDNEPETKSFTVTQPLFNGGGTVARTQSAVQVVKAGRETLRNTEQTILLSAITAYMDIVRDTAVLDLSKTNETVLTKRLDMTRERFNVGELTRTDVSQSEARLSQSVADRVRAAGNLEIARSTFERVVRIKPGTALKKPVKLPSVPASLEKALEAAYSANPQMLAAYHQQKAASKDVNIAVADLLPNANLQLQRSDQDSLSSFRGGTYEEDSITLNVRVPLYQGGGEYSRVRQSKRQAERRKQDLNATRDRVTETVTQSWERLLTARATIKSYKDAVKAAEVALEGVQLEADFGTRTTLDTLDAQQELFRSQVDLVRAERDEVVAIYTLLASIGGLNPSALALNTETYNPVAHYDDVKYKILGF